MTYLKSILVLMIASFLSISTVDATVLIFYTDSDGITHCDVRHDLDDCGFANVNPAVDCLPWFDLSNEEPTTINGAAIEPTKEDTDYNEIKPPARLNHYDSYLVSEVKTKKGTQISIKKISKASNATAVLRLASNGDCGAKHKVVSIPASKKNVIYFGKKPIEIENTNVTQKYGDILIDGVPLEFD